MSDITFDIDEIEKMTVDEGLSNEPLNYSRDAMLYLINRDEVLGHVYKEKTEQFCDKSLSFDQLGIDRAIRAVFDERVAGSQVGLYDGAWRKAIEEVGRPREYDEIPKHDETTTQIQRLLYLHGWKGFTKAFIRFCKIKQAEMQNCGFDGQVEKWNKIESAIKKLSSIQAMS